MAEYKWIKIVTDIFDDDKIKLIEGMPKRDTVLVVWFKLLCLAGKQNNNGVFVLNDRVAYTPNMLATIFNRPEKDVKAALDIFEQYGMIEYIDGVLTIPKWGKHQQSDAYERKKESDRVRQQKKRDMQRDIVKNSRVTSRDVYADVTLAEEERERDIDTLSLRESESAQARTPAQNKYGEYKNVELTDEELEKLKAEYTDYEQRIERLSEYMANTGKRYASHYLTIRSWAKKDAEKAAEKEKKGSFNTDEFFEAALERSRETTKKLREMYGDGLPVTGQGGRHEK